MSFDHIWNREKKTMDYIALWVQVHFYELLLAFSLILKQFWMLFVRITKEKYVLSFYWKNSLDHDY